MFQFGSDRLVSVLFGSSSSISNYYFPFSSVILDPPFFIFNYEFKFVISDSNNEFRPIRVMSILDPPFRTDNIIIIDYNYNSLI